MIRHAGRQGERRAEYATSFTLYVAYRDAFTHVAHKSWHDRRAELLDAHFACHRHALRRFENAAIVDARRHCRRAWDAFVVNVDNAYAF